MKRAMTAAEEMREAVRLMRERAEAATPGEWSIVPGASNVWRFPDEGIPTLIAPGNGSQGHRIRPENAAHIASWHPDVALAVARVLEERAGEYERWLRQGNGQPRLIPFEFTAAHDVARAYLGTR